MKFEKYIKRSWISLSQSQAKTQAESTSQTSQITIRQIHRNWSIGSWFNVVFNDESKICIGSGEDKGKSVWRLQNERGSKNCSNFYL